MGRVLKFTAGKRQARRIVEPNDRVRMVHRSPVPVAVYQATRMLVRICTAFFSSASADSAWIVRFLGDTGGSCCAVRNDRVVGVRKRGVVRPGVSLPMLSRSPPSDPLIETSSAAYLDSISESPPYRDASWSTATHGAPLPHKPAPLSSR
jgi:hypothetical protein